MYSTPVYLQQSKLPQVSREKAWIENEECHKEWTETPSSVNFYKKCSLTHKIVEDLFVSSKLIYNDGFYEVLFFLYFRSVISTTSNIVMFTDECFKGVCTRSKTLPTSV